MRRDWDTMRRIMLKVEALPTEDSELLSGEIEGVDGATAAYHMRLLLEAGLMVGGCRDALGPPSCWAQRLTWNGHEFLERIRRDTVWAKVKEQARTRGIDLSLEVISAAARRVIEAMLGA